MFLKVYVSHIENQIFVCFVFQFHTIFFRNLRIMMEKTKKLNQTLFLTRKDDFSVFFYFLSFAQLDLIPPYCNMGRAQI